MKDKEYNKWKKSVNNHKEVRKRKDILISQSKINQNPYFIPPTIKQEKSYWVYFRDTTILIFILILIILFAMRTFYPESYRDVITPICNPVFNHTDNTINFNNATCNNVCELECPDFPSKLRIEMVNGS